MITLCFSKKSSPGEPACQADALLSPPALPPTACRTGQAKPRIALAVGCGGGGASTEATAALAAIRDGNRRDLVAGLILALRFVPEREAEFGTTWRACGAGVLHIVRVGDFV